MTGRSDKYKGGKRMYCPLCGSDKISVLDTISRQKDTLRRRKCDACNTKFFTQENITDSEDIARVFSEWSKERTRKYRAKQKGVEYEVSFADGREKPATPKKPTSPLF